MVLWASRIANPLNSLGTARLDLSSREVKFRLVLLAVLVLASNMGVNLPSRVWAQVDPQPGSYGPLVKTYPHTLYDDEVSWNHGYSHIQARGWGFDPIDDRDPLKDYFVVFVKLTTYATASGWCVGDGR